MSDLVLLSPEAHWVEFDLSERASGNYLVRYSGYGRASFLACSASQLASVARIYLAGGYRIQFSSERGADWITELISDG